MWVMVAWLVLSFLGDVHHAVQAAQGVGRLLVQELAGLFVDLEQGPLCVGDQSKLLWGCSEHLASES